jgi:TFIIF-interacting CTD phosphatase-like protein
MSTVGGSDALLGSKVKEEHDVQNMKPSNEFFSFDKMNYVQQLREDRQAIQAWNRSFAESINEIKVEYKDIFKKTVPRFQKQFAKAPGIRKKTIVFGLDRVLVKTNFEKESDDWKATTLTLNEDTGSRIQIYVSVRPFVKNTLQQLRRADYELVLYSTSQYNYTSAILDILHKQRIEFHHIITSEDHEDALMSEYNVKKQTVPSKNMNLFLHNRKERDIIFVD